MKYLAFALFLTCVAALPYSSIDDEEGEQYHLVPLRRYRRQNQKTSFHIESPGIATVSHTGTIIDNPNHHLEGTGYASKDISRGFGLKPDAYGARADYSHKPSGAGFGLGADHFRGAGTDVKASGTWNFVQTKNAQVGVGGEYGRHFGAGGSRPDYGVFLRGTARF